MNHRQLVHLGYGRDFHPVGRNILPDLVHRALDDGHFFVRVGGPQAMLGRQCPVVA